MNKSDFSHFRKKLGKTQQELADLLGIALKTVHSYEQGWRKIPVHIERQIYFLLCRKRDRKQTGTPCWERYNCQEKQNCPAWEFQSGNLCWFLNGTLCKEQGKNDEEKIILCRQCEILKSLLEDDDETK